jgi:hypothetical protein
MCIRVPRRVLEITADGKVDFARWLAGRDEIAAGVTMARSAMGMGLERGREMSTAGAGAGSNWWEKAG